MSLKGVISMKFKIHQVKKYTCGKVVANHHSLLLIFEQNTLNLNGSIIANKLVNQKCYGEILRYKWELLIVKACFNYLLGLTGGTFLKRKKTSERSLSVNDASDESIELCQVRSTSSPSISCQQSIGENGE